jgi:flavodoxin
MDLAAARLAVRSRVWVAGDALTGPSTVVEAMAQGREAARAILLDRPRRPGSGQLGGPRRVLVAYESETGRTKRAGAMLARILTGAGAEVRAAHLRDVQTPDLAWADLLVIGTWVEGMVAVGVRPAKGTRAFLRRLPLMAGKKVVLYCTYAVSPGKTLDIMRQRFERSGARVLAEGRFSRWSLATAPGKFGRELVDTLWPAMTEFEIADKARELAGGCEADAMAELRWLAAGSRVLLQDARALLRAELRTSPGDETARAAARLLAAVLAQELPVAQVGRPEGCIA